VFETDACIKMLFFKLKKEYWSGVKTILTFLNYMPPQVANIYDCDIQIDPVIADELRKL
jgi:hypothetical protein